jgi:hypothetical protein
LVTLPTKTVTIVRLKLGAGDALNYARLEGETKSLVRDLDALRSVRVVPCCSLCAAVMPRIVLLELGPEEALNYARLEGETKSLVRDFDKHRAVVIECIVVAATTAAVAFRLQGWSLRLKMH